MNKADILRTYIAWSNEGEVASCEDLALHSGYAFSVDQVYEFTHSARVGEFLATKHGLMPPPRAKSRRDLSDAQVRWLTACTNPYTRLPIAKLCILHGITLEQHRRWMKQAAFSRRYNELMRAEIKGTEGELYRKTASKAMDGDSKAVELLYRMQNKPLPQSIAADSVGGVPVERVLQIMQSLLSKDQLAVAATLLANPGLEPTPALDIPDIPNESENIHDD